MESPRATSTVGNVADLDRLASRLADRAEIERLEAKLGALEKAVRGQT